jgi:DNA-binding MarR family transcriptional regulator
MEDEGMVERRFNPDDRREIRVSLTPHGADIDRSIMEALKSTDEAGLRGLSNEDLEALMTLLSRIRDNLISFEEEKKGESR